jgi:hypothetical protein
VAISETLADGVPVRPLLCVHGGRWPGGRRSVEGVTLVTPRHLADVLRDGTRLAPREVERATTRVLEVLCPAV